MSDQLTLGVALAAGLVVCLVIFAGMHEKHYRDRRGQILATRFQGLETRVATLETIITEDRLT